ncbi:MAG: response regulator [Spirochaetaceae bacterium]|nr:MAG: response regulator [Spirochaetaceae bacterium]
MSEGALILVVDDDVSIRRMLRLSLEAHGYQTLDATTAAEGLALAASKHPDLVILDLGLPDSEGEETLVRLREWSMVPVIVLTVLDSDESKISLLDAGASDYVTKPFSMGELLARIRVTLRNIIPDQSVKLIRSKGIVIDLEARVVRKSDEEIRLTPTEYVLLKYLAANAGKVVTRNDLIRELWGADATPDESYLRVYMLQLRKKIEDDPALPEILLTVPGIGYRFYVLDPA